MARFAVDYHYFAFMPPNQQNNENDYYQWLVLVA